MHKEEQKTAEPPKPPGLFDNSAPVSTKPTLPADADEEAEILAEIREDEESEEEDEALIAS